ncbi:MAG: iron-sulfur cluster biosynthesis family protein [Lactococcus sp.]
MKITFDETVSQRLSELKKTIPADLVLDFDHTLSRELVGQDCCGITRYRLVLIEKNQLPDVFDGSIPSNCGLIYYKKWGSMYLDPQMQIRKNGPLIEIMGAGELIAPNIEIVDFRNEQIQVTIK